MIDLSERLAGILLPAFALRRDDDLGIGDTAAIKQAIDFCARNNCAVLQLLPINETGGDNSPYNAISSIALDPVLLTIEPNVVPGLTTADLAELAAPAVVSDVQTGAVDYPKVKQLKFQLLRRAFDNFQKQPNRAELVDFENFQREQMAWLPDYTLFRTLIELHGGNACWTQWLAEQRTPKAAEKWLSSSPDSTKLTTTRQFFAFVQWVAFTQWRDVRKHSDAQKVRLMGDIPFGVSRYSADVWANQELFDLDWSGGAPPETWFKDDLFTAKWGQNWGLPLYHWDAHKKQKFLWWRQRVQKVVEIFHYFRIDHVLGFFRIYSFPWQPEQNGEYLELSEAEAKKKTGGRLPQFLPRSDEEDEDAEKNAADGAALLEMILDASGNAGVVAEDLGSMVPPYVRPLLQKLGIPGFTIPYWERTEDQELKLKETLPELSLATYATHDHTPLKLFYEDAVKSWLGPDGDAGWLEIQRLMRFLGLDKDAPPKEFTPELHRQFMKALLETPCWLAVFMITDLLGTSERFNQPGTSGASNWSRRLDYPLAQYEKTKPYSERISDFAKLVKETRRLPQAWPVGTIR